MTKTSEQQMSDPWSRTLGPLSRSSFPYLALLYAAFFGALGTEAPFFPSYIASRGMSAREIGLILGTGAVVRLCAGPVFGSLADRFGTRGVLAFAASLAGLIGLLYLGGASFWVLLFICMLHSIVIAPLNALADTLAVTASRREGLFPYGWVRGVGSASFVAGTLASGQLVAGFGLDSIIVTSSILLILMVVPIDRLPPAASASAVGTGSGIRVLFSQPVFRSLLLVACLVIGSHAMSDTFAVIHWRKSGISAPAISVLLAQAMLSELAMFLIVGPMLLKRFGPARCATIAAIAGVARWAVFAESTNFSVLAVTELLHGLTFSLMHLACMQFIGQVVPERFSALAQTLYGTLCLGIASAAVTFLSGELYGPYGGKAFWLMSGLCLVAIPFTIKLGRYQAAQALANP